MFRGLRFLFVEAVFTGCIRRSILTESSMKSAKTKGAMMVFQIAEARKLMATMSLALAIMHGGPAGTAVAQVTVLLPTDGDIKATLALPGDIQRGKEAYAECQTCHRQDGSGRAKFDIPRLSGQHASVLIKQLMDIRSGLRVNPEMKDYMFDSDLTLQDFADMAAYLQSLPVAGKIGQGPPELVARGQALYASDCASSTSSSVASAATPTRRCRRS